MSKQIEAMKRWVEVFDGNWHDEPVDSEWADRAHQALAEMRQAIAEAEQPAQQEQCCYGGIAHDCHAGVGCRIAERLTATPQPPAQQEKNT